MKEFNVRSGWSQSANIGVMDNADAVTAPNFPEE
jgi:hypothetical protein